MNEKENNLTNEQAKEYFLKTANTKHLLALVKKINNIWDYCDNVDESLYNEEINVNFLTKGGISNSITLLKDELKVELSKREHIPSSIESKKLRQKLAKKYRKGIQGKKDKQR